MTPSERRSDRVQQPPSDPSELGDVQGRVVSTVNPAGWSTILDLTTPSAARLGVTSELAAGNDYRLSAQWAEAAHVAGFDAIWYLPRFTPGQEYAAGVFGDEGSAPDFPVVETVPLAHQIRRLGYVVANPPRASVLHDGDALDPDQG